MSTTRQIEANRRNAARSTGPRSAAGKARARMNALRHGLSARTGEDHARVQAVVGAGAGDGADAGSGANEAFRACAVAAVQCAFDLARVQAVVTDLIEQVYAVDGDASESAAVRQRARAQRLELVRAIVRVQRYADAALARRRRALYAYIREMAGVAFARNGCGPAKRTQSRPPEAPRRSRTMPGSRVLSRSRVLARSRVLVPSRVLASGRGLASGRLLARTDGIEALRRTGLLGRITVSRLTWWRLCAHAGFKEGVISSRRLATFTEALMRHVHAAAIARGATWAQARTRVRWRPDTGLTFDVRIRAGPVARPRRRNRSYSGRARPRQPLLRSPAEIPLMVSWIPRTT